MATALRPSCRPVPKSLPAARVGSCNAALLRQRLPARGSAGQPAARAASLVARAELKALIFDCDGVILESEDYHLKAYNDAFEYFDCRIGGQRVFWSETYYDDLQNKVGGGKPKMRFYFNGDGWPTSSVLPATPTTDTAKEQLVDTLQAWKTTHYQTMVGSGDVDPRPGVLRLMDDAREAGLAVGVCSAGTKSSIVAVLGALLGEGRFKGLDVFLAGDDVPQKKPDPMIYNQAAIKLGLDPASCVVVEDSAIGAAAAAGAGMRCVITYTRSTRDQAFASAERIVGSLIDETGRPTVTVAELAAGRVVQDDRVDLRGV